jgi:hypothetical protein
VSQRSCHGLLMHGRMTPTADRERAVGQGIEVGALARIAAGVVGRHGLLLIPGIGGGEVVIEWRLGESCVMRLTGRFRASWRRILTTSVSLVSLPMSLVETHRHRANYL